MVDFVVFSRLQNWTNPRYLSQTLILISIFSHLPRDLIGVRFRDKRREIFSGRQLVDYCLCIGYIDGFIVSAMNQQEIPGDVLAEVTG